MSKFEGIGQFKTDQVTQVDLELTDTKLAEIFADPDNRELAEVSAQNPDSFEKEYRTELTEWRASKREYQTLKSNYESSLAEYYQNYSDKNLTGRAGQKMSEWWKGKPAELQSLEADYKRSRQQYAIGLESVLQTRGELREQNVKYDAAGGRTKKAFAEKFILQPKADQLAVETEHLMDSETQERAAKILNTLKKHKWAMRVGVVATTGLVVGSGAGLVAGAAAGGIKAARIAGGMAGGYLGAKYGDKIGSAGIEEARERLVNTQESTVANFSVADINSLEIALHDAERTVDIKERRRKFAIVAGAVIGGGSMANLDNIGAAFVSEAAASTPSNPAEEAGEIIDTVDSDEGTIPTEELLATAENQAVLNDNAPEITNEPISLPVVSSTLNTTADYPHFREMFNRNLADAQAEAVEAVAETEQFPDTLIGDHMVESGDTLWKITKESFAEHLAGLSGAEQDQVLDSVFDKLRLNPELTTQLGVKSGNIDLIYADDTLKMSLLKELIETELSESIVEAIPGSVAVETGNMLWSITADAYAEQLAPLSEVQKNQVLYSVFDKLRFNPELTTQLGVKSGNIDLITPNDTLNISLLRTLLNEQVATYTEADRAQSTPETPAAEGTPSSSIESMRPDTVPENLPTGIPNEVLVETSSAAPTESIQPEMPPDTPGTSVFTESLSEQETPVPTKATFTNAEYTRIIRENGLSAETAIAALETFGSSEAFIAAKISAIESLVGPQPRSWMSGEQFNPFYRKMSPATLGQLQEVGIMNRSQFSDVEKNDFLRSINMDVSESNRTDLAAWHSFYRDINQPARLRELEIETTPNMEFDELFNKYVIAIAKK